MKGYIAHRTAMILRFQKSRTENLLCDSAQRADSDGLAVHISIQSDSAANYRGNSQSKNYFWPVKQHDIP
jgi:hypothetical protein